MLGGAYCCGFLDVGLHFAEFVRRYVVVVSGRELWCSSGWGDLKVRQGSRFGGRAELPAESCTRVSRACVSDRLPFNVQQMMIWRSALMIKYRRRREIDDVLM